MKVDEKEYIEYTSTILRRFSNNVLNYFNVELKEGQELVLLNEKLRQLSLDQELTSTKDSENTYNGLFEFLRYKSPKIYKFDPYQIKTEAYLARENNRSILWRYWNELKLKILDVSSYRPIFLSYNDIFYVKEGENPPIGYNPDRDLLISDESCFVHATSSIQYLIGKAIYNHSSTLRPHSKSSFQNFTKKDVFLNYEFQDMEACHHLFTLEHRDSRQSNYQIVCLSKYALLSMDMDTLLQKTRLTRELVIILKDEECESIEKREQIRHALIDSITEKHFTAPVHLLFQTKLDITTPLSLLNCRNSAITTNELYSKMPGNSGYYCCDKTLLINKQSLQSTASDDLSAKPLPTIQTKKESEGYIIEEQTHNDRYRASKQKSALSHKASATVGFVNQIEVAQQQAVSATEQMNREVTEAVSEQTSNQRKVDTWFNQNNYSIGLPDNVTYELFCMYLQKQSIHLTKQLDELIQATNPFITQSYLNKIKRLIEKISTDEKFRRTFAAGIFGHVIYKNNDMYHSYKLSTLDVLPNYSREILLPIIIMYVDGLNFSKTEATIIKVIPFFRNTLSFGLHVYGPYAWSQQENALKNKRIYSTVDDVVPVERELLLFVPNSNPISLDEQQKWIECIDYLLEKVHSKKPIEPNAFEAMTQTVLSLVKLYFKHSPHVLEYRQVLKKLIEKFELSNADNWRILIYLFMTHRHPGLDVFFQLLMKLDKEQRIQRFYQLYFESAVNITELSLGLNQQNQDLKLKLFLLDSQKDALFIDFYEHFLIFLSHHSIMTKRLTIDEAEYFWKQIYDEFLIFSRGDAEKAKVLREKLVNNLISEEHGFNIESLSNIDTIFNGLLTVIQNAIRHGTLEEQLESLDGLSFKWLDLNYPIEKNGFRVLSKEMQLDFSKQNYLEENIASFPTYHVSSQDLLNCIKEYPENNANLKCTLFRILGIEGLKAPLPVYKALYDTSTLAYGENTLSFCLKEKMIAYIAFKTTGTGYGSPLDSEKLTSELFLLCKEEVTASVKGYIQYVIDRYNHLMTESILPTTTLWSECHFYELYQGDVSTIPTILTEKFDAKALMPFVLTQQQSLKSNVSFFERHKRETTLYFLRACVSSIFTQRGISHEKLPFLILDQFYKDESFTAIIDDLPLINRFSHAYATIINGSIGLSLSDVLRYIIKNRLFTLPMPTMCSVLEFTADVVGEESNEKKIDVAAYFIMEIANHPLLIPFVKEASPLLAALLKEYFESDIANQWPLADALIVAEKILSIDKQKCIEPQWISLLKQPKFVWLIRQYPDLTATQLQAIGYLVTDRFMPIDLIERCLSQNHHYPFDQLIQSVKEMDDEYLALLFRLWEMNTTKTSITEFLSLAKNDLEKVIRLLENKQLTQGQLNTLIQKKPFRNALKEFERSIYTENLNRFDMPDGAYGAALSISCLNPEYQCTFQKCLWDDYQFLLKYAKSIHHLSKKDLRQQLSSLKNNIKDEANKIKILAIACEVMFRTTSKFPRYTQIYPVLLSLYENQNLIQQIKTGEGKSIITALQAVLFDAEEKQIHIATENTTLAKEHIHQFYPFYKYLGIRCSRNTLNIDGLEPLLHKKGVYCSTVGDIVLWKMKLKLENRPLPKKVALICDEIDANLTRTLQYIYAAPIDPIYKDIHLWKRVYELMMQFVKEQKIFKKNHCARHEDVQNFKLYFQFNNQESKWNELIKTIPDSCLDELIEAALTAEALEDDIDSLSVDDPRHESHPYAAPIMDYRPAPRVSYSNNVQQLFHTQLNEKRKKSSTNPYWIEAPSQSFMIQSVKNFFDEYRLNGGRIIGFTGTAGSALEIEEFYSQHGFLSYQYPTYHQSHCVTKPTIKVTGQDDLLKKLYAHVSQNKSRQPMILFVDTPKKAQALELYLKSKCPHQTIQMFDGYEPIKGAESSLIQRAGITNTVTIATQCLARGVDFATEHPDGYVIINTCTDITESDYEQMKGRTARNGKNGTFYSILDSTAYEGEFDEHRLLIGKQKQKERLKTQLLQDVRNFIVEQYFLKVRHHLDKIYQKQCGQSAHFIDQHTLMTHLFEFNQEIEKIYNDLLNDKSCLTEDAKEKFLAEVVESYNQRIKSIVGTPNITALPIVEPLVPLEVVSDLKTLKLCKLKDLTLLSHFLSNQWQYFGNQQSNLLCEAGDRVVNSIEQFQSTENKSELAESLVNEYLSLNGIQMDELLKDVDIIANFVNGEFLSEVKNIPVIGRFIPIESIQKNAKEYFTATKKAIQERKWSSITLPPFDFSDFKTWYNRYAHIKNCFGIFSTTMAFAGGPVTFLLNMILLPVICNVIKNLFSKLASNTIENVKSTTNSLPIHIIAGLNELRIGVSPLLNHLSDPTQYSNQSIGEWIDKLKPIFNNSAVAAIIKLKKSKNDDHAETNLWDRLENYFKVFNKVGSIVEKHRDKKWHEFFKSDILFDIYVQSIQIDEIKQQLGLTKSDPSQLLAMFSALKPFISSLSVKQTFSLFKLLAHPQFYQCLHQLNGEITFAQLQSWLKDDTQALPEAAKKPLNELKAYQSDAKRIEADTEHYLRTLESRFTLTNDQLKKYLNDLTPKPTIPNSAVVEQKEKSKVSHKKALSSHSESSPSFLSTNFAFLSLQYALLITVNIIFFSMTLLIASILFASMMTYQYVAAQNPAFIKKWTPSFRFFNGLVKQDNRIQDKSNDCAVRFSAGQDRLSCATI